jgi:hypothetical protein
VTTQISTIELNPELVNMAYEMGLNVSKTCENGLKEAIRRLKGLNFENTSVRNAGFAITAINSTKSVYARGNVLGINLAPNSPILYFG